MPKADHRGFAAVYRVVDVDLDSVVALEVIGHPVVTDEDVRQRLRLAARGSAFTGPFCIAAARGVGKRGSRC